MGRRTSYTPGTPSWVDLTTTDVADAKRFYGEVFGWTVRDAPTAGYEFFEHGGATVAGLQPLMEEQRALDMPPCWSMYVCTDDAAATAARAVELGGAVVVEPLTIPEAGRTGAVADPQGGVVLLWEPGAFAGAALVNEVGAWAWNDLQTTDPEAAAPFYEALFGWTITEVPGSGGIYRSIAHEGRNIGGVMRAQGGITQPYWTVYIGVEDADTTLARIAAAGGRTMVEPMTVPGGRFAVALDPQDAVVCLVESQFDD
jgi:predicted enzyme related to lactoylglutathione lyase